MHYLLTHYTSAFCHLPVIQQTVTIIKRRQARYKYVTFEARSRDHFCTVKAINVKYYEYVFVALVIQHAMRMRGVVVWNMSGSTEIFQITSKTARFSSTKLCISHILLWFFSVSNVQLLLSELLLLRSQCCSYPRDGHVADNCTH
jgi:hypothetical protein